MNKIIKDIISIILPDKLYISLQFHSRLGYWINWKKTQTFCEKIQYLKIKSKNRIDFTQMVDKVDSKQYVESIIGKEYIIPTIGIWNRFDEINFEELPEGIIIKCAHDSSRGIVIKDKKDINKEKIKERITFFQNRSYFRITKEYPYKNVPHRIIAEKYLTNGIDNELKDYKFYCFNGKAEFCQIIANRTTNETIDFYDRDWNHQDFIGLNSKASPCKTPHIKPTNYSEMCSIADKISAKINWPFVRVDLYNVNGHIYFGEITFFPASGLGRFYPNEWNYKLGNLIQL